MVGFLIKKVFFDIWDNLIRLVCLSVLFLVIIFGFLLSATASSVSLLLSIAIILLSLLVFSFYSLGVSAIVHGYSKYQNVGFKGFKEAFVYHWTHAIVHFVINIIMLVVLFYVIPFYFSMGNVFGLILGMILFWVLVIVFLSMQFYFPLCFHMEGDRALKTLKKCFIVFGDNMGIGLFLFLRTIIDLVLTVVTASMIPGVAGIALSRMDTVRLLMKKYDFLEEHPECSKKDINWDDLLYEERELVGPRSLKGMIFPWKD